MANVFSRLKNLQYSFINKEVADFTTTLLLDLEKVALWPEPGSMPSPLVYPAVTSDKSKLSLDWVSNPAVCIQIDGSEITKITVSKWSDNLADPAYRETWEYPKREFVLDLIPRVLNLR